MIKFLRSTLPILLVLWLATFSAQAQNCTVNAGIPDVVCPGQTFQLLGASNGKYLGGDRNSVWSQVSGPAVIITNPDSLVTTVTGWTAGNVYKFRITARCLDGSLVYDEVTVSTLLGTVANAGSDINSCPSTIALSANAATLPGETGAWSFVGDSHGVTINDPFSPVTTVTLPTTNSGTTVLRWTITGGNCATYDDMTITNSGGVMPVSAGGTINLDKCYSTTRSATLNGSYAGDGTNGQQGTWSFISGPSVPVFANVHLRNTNVSNLSNGTYRFRWTVSGPCASGFSEVDVVVDPGTQNITSAGNGGTQTFCDTRTTATLTGKLSEYTNEVVSWTQISGAPVTITNPTSSTTTITGLNSTLGPYEFRYKIRNSVTECESEAVYRITYTVAPSISLTSPASVSLACNVSAATITFNVSGGNRTEYALVSGPGGSTYEGRSGAYDYSETGNTISLTGLDKIGTYVFRIRRFTNNGTGGCTEASEDVSITTSRAPSLSNAGTDQILACNVFQTDLAGNLPVNGTGKWSQVSGPNTAVMADANLRNTHVSGMINGLYVFRWIISGNPNCQPQQDEVLVRVANIVPATIAAGSDETVCNGTQIRMNGNVPALTWQVVPSAGVVFGNIHDPKTVVNGLQPSTSYKFIWQITNGCMTGYDTITITTTSNIGPGTANAGPDQCITSSTTTIILTGNDIGVDETGTWTLLSSPSGNNAGYTSNHAKDSVLGAILGTYTFEWRLDKGGCTPSRDTVMVTIAASPLVADANLDQNLCGASDSATLSGSTPGANEIGTWTQVSGPGGVIIHNPNAPECGLSGLTPGRYTFRWTISNGACSIFDEVELNIATPPSTPVASLTDTIIVCNATSKAMAAVAPSVGTGIWSVISGPNTPTFANVASPTTNVTNLKPGTYRFKWTVSNGIYCSPLSDTVVIVVTQAANAGPDQSICNTPTAVVSGNEGTFGTWTQVSGPGYPGVQATITATPSPGNTAVLTGLTPGTYVFRYALPVTPCAPSNTDDVSIVVSPAPDTAQAGNDQNICLPLAQSVASVTLAATPVSNPSAGTWTVASKPAGSNPVITTPGSATSTFTNLAPGTYELEWNVVSGSCGNGGTNKDLVKITISKEPETPNAGSDQPNSCIVDVILTANTPSYGLGTWTQVGNLPAVATIVAPNSPTTNIIASVTGTYQFAWTISNGTCTPKSDTISVAISSTPPDTAKAGADQELCQVTTATLNGNTPSAGQTGSWTIISKPLAANPSFSPDSDTSGAELQNLIPGVYELRYSINKGTCVSFDDVKITIYEEPSQAIAGGDQSVCLYSAAPIKLDATPVTVGTGTWNVVSKPALAADPVFVPNNHAPKASLAGLVSGTYVFEWVTANGTCPSTVNTTDEVTINIIEPPTLANAGSDQVVCQGTTTITLAGNDPTAGTGTWTLVSGPMTPSITFINEFNTTVTGVTDAGNYVFRWTIDNGGGTVLDEVKITVQPAIANNTILSAPQTICYNTTPASILATDTPALTGGNGTTYAYQWQKSTTSASAGFTNIPGATSKNYSPGTLTETTWYLRRVTSGTCVIPNESAAVKITVQPEIINKIDTPLVTIFCASGDPGTIDGHAGSGGSGTYTYEWQKSTVADFSSSVTGNLASTEDYAPGNLTTTTYFRRKITSEDSVSCSTFSNIVRIVIQPGIAGNTVTATNNICNNTPAALTGSVSPALSGGNGTYAYQWQVSSTTNEDSEFADIPSATSANYTSAALTTVLVPDTLWYRRIVTSGSCVGLGADTSSAFMVIVNPVLTGNTITAPVENIFCATGDALQITGSTPSGGNGVYSYQWLQSTNGISGWGNATAGSGNATSVHFGYLVQTCGYFRRLYRHKRGRKDHDRACACPDSAKSCRTADLRKRNTDADHRRNADRW